MPFIRLADIEPRRIEWLARGRIPRATVTLLDGAGGVGKGLLTAGLGAAVSTGGMFLGERIEPGGVVLMGEEDDYESTVLTRLVTNGANLDAIVFARGEQLTFAQDLPRIEKAVMVHRATLLVVDPLSDFLGTATTGEQSVRRVLTSARRMAERTGVAILGVRHLRKDRSSAQQAGLGSAAFTAVARSGLIVARDQLDEDVVHLAQYKCNVGPKSPTLRIRINGVIPELLGETDRTADEILRPYALRPRPMLQEAVQFLEDTLSEGAVRAERVMELARAAGHSRKTLLNAKQHLECESSKEEGVFQGRWYWHLAGDPRLAPEGPPVDEGHLRGNELGATNDTAMDTDEPLPSGDLPSRSVAQSAPRRSSGPAAAAGATTRRTLMPAPLSDVAARAETTAASTPVQLPAFGAETAAPDQNDGEPAPPRASDAVIRFGLLEFD